MKLGPIRQIFRPLFGLEHRETTARFLYAILISALLIESLLIIIRWLGGETLSDTETLRLLVFLLGFEIILLFAVKRGYVRLAAFALVLVAWASITYQIWDARGVHDVAVFSYILVIFIAALLVNWRVSIILSALSIVSIWAFAIAEFRGLRLADIDNPIDMASDLTAIFTLLVLLVYLVIDTLRHSSDALHVGEAKYRNFVEQSMEGIWFLTFNPPISTGLPAEEQVDLIYKRGYISECNDTLAHMYGFKTSAELLGANVLNLTSDEELNEINYRATLTLVKEGYRSSNRETQERTRAGKPVYFLNSAVGVIENGYLVGLWGTQLDITALKDTEAALRRSEARTRALLDAVPDMIFELRKDGAILQVISSASNPSLRMSEQFVGKTIREVFPSVVDQMLFAIGRVLKSGELHAFEYSLKQGDENRTFEARVTYLSADSVLTIIRDVSIQKWIQGEREDLISELERKNAELERFTYTVSHDLKSPLITIKGFLGFLRDDAQTGNSKRLNADLQRISDAADKMQRLLNDLLELSRIGRLVNESQSIDFNKLIAEVLELLHGRIHEGKIRVSVEDDLPEVYGDRPRLFEVLQNLIDNAAKFMGDQPDPCIEIGRAGAAADGASVFFVRDNGIGIDPKFKDRIFGLFDKLDPLTDGTGIGLALAKRIIEFHGGRIWVESEPGQGATFYFALPPPDDSHLNAG